MLLAMFRVISMSEVMEADEIEKLLPNSFDKDKRLPYSNDIYGLLIRKIVDGMTNAYKRNFDKLYLLLKRPWSMNYELLGEDSNIIFAKGQWAQNLPALAKILTNMVAIARRQDRVGQWAIIHRFSHHYQYESTPETKKAFDMISTVAKEAKKNLLKKATDVVSAIEIWELAERAFEKPEDARLRPFLAKILEFTGRKTKDIVDAVKTNRPNNSLLLLYLLQEAGDEVELDYCDKALGLRA